ncbi:hypothetical protein [Candidatus Similichlamydia laticola]|uniref:Uncharacterized protein n=1 Tax=Candidatus Similichlamydia laticola TaxID=2170265 RepID=A0A369KCQ3_9BACT|nr:hypothetical protein [Candidatus Similichlamydia laticola]RDB31688.1 hypothetical protein HAT2_00197 [Candidatus Similichlamydia laticola]
MLSKCVTWIKYNMQQPQFQHRICSIGLISSHALTSLLYLAGLVISPGTLLKVMALASAIISMSSAAFLIMRDFCAFPIQNKLNVFWFSGGYFLSCCVRLVAILTVLISLFSFPFSLLQRSILFFWATCSLLTLLESLPKLASKQTWSTWMRQEDLHKKIIFLASFVVTGINFLCFPLFLSLV